MSQMARWARRPPDTDAGRRNMFLLVQQQGT